MTFKKKIMVVAAAGALSAISAVPAMAFENEFHGSYTFNTVFSNYLYGVGQQYNPTRYNDTKQMNNYFEQRGRIQYIAKASDDLKLVTHFELDTRFGGITGGKYTGTTGDGGTLDTDGINLETKHLYLDFNLGSNFNVKTGLMPYKDTIKGLFIDADVPAIYTTTKLGAYNLGLGFARVQEINQDGSATNFSRLGDKAVDVFLWDNTFNVNKDTKAAFSYYFLADYRTVNTALINTLGLSGETKIGPASLSGFMAMQAGHIKNTDGRGNNTYVHGWAANATAKVAAGPGSFKTAFLFTSGDNNTSPDMQYRGWINSTVNSYNDSGLMILARNTANRPTNTDGWLRRMVSNIAVYSLGYDANITNKFYLNSNVGFAWVPSSKDAPVDKSTIRQTQNASDFMGTEINLEPGYKVNDNLTLRAQMAYAILGGYYKGSAANSTVLSSKDPDNPYAMHLLVSFKF